MSLFELDEIAGVGRIRFRKPVELQSADVPRVLDESDRLLDAAPPRHLLVDLTNLQRLGSSGLLLFFNFADRVELRGGRCVFYGAQGALWEFMNDHGVPERFLVASNEFEALRLLLSE